MARYFTRPKAATAFYVEDDTYSEPSNFGPPTVPDHEATDTGLLDVTGSTIWRGPPPMGFQFWDGEQ